MTLLLSTQKNNPRVMPKAREGLKRWNKTRFNVCRRSIEQQESEITSSEFGVISIASIISS